MDAADGQAVTGFEGEALYLLGGHQFLIGSPTLNGGLVGAFAIVAVVENRAYGDARDQLGQAADVVFMKVGDQDIVNAGDSGSSGSGHDTIGVAAVIAGPPGVDEEGFAGGSDEASGLAAFDVDKKDAERFRSIGSSPR